MGLGEEAMFFQGNSAENNWELIENKDQEEDEEFYEKIEAPKFVDFTIPNHHGPDDRYWFCLRVGCDQKHEEEMDPEDIYKKFVLRVMAARSPNVRFHKALHRNASSKSAKKCPLSAPPKPAKSVLPRFAIVSSLSKRIGDDIEKAKPQAAKVCSTPKAKGKQVSSKYLTTPTYKKCPPNLTSFQSVGKPKSPTTLVLPKSRIVAKALNFQSPIKEELKLKKKKTMELHTPVEKLCQGLKNLEIMSQSKRVLGYSSKISKPVAQKSPTTLSTREKEHKFESSVQPHIQNSHGAKSSRSIKHKNQVKLSKSCNPKEGSVPNVSCAAGSTLKSRSVNDENDESVEAAKNASSAVTEVPLTTEHGLEADKGGDDSPRPQITSKENESTDENEKESTVTGGAGCAKNASSAVTEVPFTTEHGLEADKGGDDSPRPQITSKGNESTDENEKESTVTAGGAGCESVVTQIDDKENALAFDGNRCVNNFSSSNLTGGEVLGIHNSQGKKDIPNVNKKGGSAAGMRMMKPKPSNPKPFRLRTDERGILKETNSEKKTDVVPSQNKVSKLSRCKDGDIQDIQKRCPGRLAAAKTPEQYMVRKTPTSLIGHSSKLQDVKHVASSTNRTKSRRDLKNILRKSTVSSRMHAMASKITPVKVVSSGKRIPPERKLNIDRNT